ncbi:hypothetical protein BT69DRAFT_808598 [Atractiella rhizophila]|nr:hypothetical protein BT69DRAFT_808598 [Atractiella rhizophila]
MRNPVVKMNSATSALTPPDISSSLQLDDQPEDVDLNDFLETLKSAATASDPAWMMNETQKVLIHKIQEAFALDYSLRV